MNNIKSIRFAQENDLEHLSELFNTYRSFYGRDSDIPLATQFLSERFKQKDSVILIAETDDQLIAGFIQLYPTFSSVSAKRAWILNDLYVSDNYRRRGVATKLIHHALDFSRETGAAWISLQTGKDNMQAQALYQRIGFVKDDYFYGFSFEF